MRDLSRRFSARAIALFDTGPKADGVRIRAAKDGEPAEILIYDVIGGDFWDDGVTSKAILAALADADGAPVRVRINSPGGDVFEGIAIYNALKNYTGGVEITVDGLAASAASVIAMAGSTVTMGEGAMLMIHNAWTLVMGDRNDMIAQAGTLEKIDGQIAGFYARFSGTKPEDWTARMDAETWLTADEAVTAGIATKATAKAEKPKAAVITPKAEVIEPDPETEKRKLRLRLAAHIA